MKICLTRLYCRIHSNLDFRTVSEAVNILEMLTFRFVFQFFILLYRYVVCLPGNVDCETPLTSIGSSLYASGTYIKMANDYVYFDGNILSARPCACMEPIFISNC